MPADSLLTRRRFLQLAGISLLGSAVGFASAAPAAAYYGRALDAAPVYPRPDAASTPLAHLWPDSMTPIREAAAGWYRSDTGYIPRALLQPIEHLPADIQIAPAPPFWAEVSAPVAALRSYCAPDAPLISRIGHGGVMQVVDSLPGAADWYGIATADGRFVGWTQALHWRPVDLRLHPLRDLDLTLDSRQLTVWQAGRAILQAPVALGGSLPEGCYAIARDLPAGPQAPTGHHGAAWTMRIGADYALSGVYWHNRFGDVMPGPSVQVTPILARWLYQHLPDETHLRVHS